MSAVYQRGFVGRSPPADSRLHPQGFQGTHGAVLIRRICCNLHPHGSTDDPRERILVEHDQKTLAKNGMKIVDLHL